MLLPLLLVAPLSGCFTAAIWGGTYDVEEGDNEPSLRFGGDRPGIDSLFLRIACTPLTLALDICLAPVQAFFYGSDDDDDC